MVTILLELVITKTTTIRSIFFRKSLPWKVWSFAIVSTITGFLVYNFFELSNLSAKRTMGKNTLRIASSVYDSLLYINLILMYIHSVKNCHMFFKVVSEWEQFLFKLLIDRTTVWRNKGPLFVSFFIIFVQLCIINAYLLWRL